MKKTYEKFNSRLGKLYWEKFVNRDIEFYESIEKVLDNYLNKNKDIKGLDIGAGPGIGAWILNKIGVSGKLFGVEPSDNYKESKKLSNELEMSGGKLGYYVEKGEMSDAISLFNLKKESLDYVLILRAAHEIMLSYRNYEEFVKDFKRICRMIKKEGVIIVADPQFSEFVNSDTKKYSEVINSIRRYKEETLGHSHTPEDYLTLKRLRELFKDDFILKEKIEIENKGDLEFIKGKGYDLEESPTKFYVVCYQKK